MKSTAASASSAPHTGRADADRSSAPGLIEFFRHHGVWAPGVRLFRRMQFRSKALIVSLAFVMPLLALLQLQWVTQTDELAATHTEREGVRYLKPLLELIKVAQVRRDQAVLQPGDPANPDSTQTRAAEELAALQSELGAQLDTQQTYAAFRQHHEALQRQPLAATPDETYAAYSEYIASAIELASGVVYRSGLILDPAEEVSHLIHMVLVYGPVQTENTAKLATLGTLVLKSRGLTPARHEALIEGTAIQRSLDNFVESSYLNGTAAMPEAQKKAFGMSETDDAFDAFLEALKTQFKPSQLGADSAAFFALGRSVVDRQDEMNAKVLARVDQELQARIDNAQRFRALVMALTLACVALAAYLFYAFFLVTQGGLREVQKHLEAMTTGDLTTHPRPWGRDEAASLMGTISTMQASLRHIVGQVRQSSNSIVHASGEISAASMDLSSRTEQTSASLEASASSMEEISSAVQQTSDRAGQAADLASRNAEVAQRGGQVIGDVVSTMGEIRRASTQISEIIGTIDGIAFQTNILALNAAVEAARAGEQGRGFAVVAGEVRSLAQRSAHAAKAIKQLIGASVDRVESGTRVVEGAGETMHELVTNAHHINELLAEIAGAAREQTGGVSQVGASVQDLDRMTQQNAALVEQTAAAASSLKDQARGLVDEVARFRLPARADGGPGAG